MDDTVKNTALMRETLLGAAGSRRRKLVLAAAAIVVVALAAAGYAAWRSGTSGPAPQYRTEPAARGNLVVTVSATGSLQPTNKVDIGSELSGTVESVYVD